MGLNKFDGDDALPTGDDLRRMVNAIESVNRETQSVFFCIVHDSQIKLVKDTLKSFGYLTSNTMVIYKQYKNDKMPTGGFVSAAVFAVVAWKDAAINKHRTLPTDGDAITRNQWMQNVWTVTNDTKPYLDAQVNL